jgi:hypothetical protein
LFCKKTKVNNSRGREQITTLGFGWWRRTWIHIATSSMKRCGDTPPQSKGMTPETAGAGAMTAMASNYTNIIALMF